MTSGRGSSRAEPTEQSQAGGGRRRPAQEGAATRSDPPASPAPRAAAPGLRHRAGGRCWGGEGTRRAHRLPRVSPEGPSRAEGLPASEGGAVTRTRRLDRPPGRVQERHSGKTEASSWEPSVAPQVLRWTQIPMLNSPEDTPKPQSLQATPAAARSFQCRQPSAPMLAQSLSPGPEYDRPAKAA